jgi:hypothetical protein
MADTIPITLAVKACLERLTAAPAEENSARSAKPGMTFTLEISRLAQENRLGLHDFEACKAGRFAYFV